MAEPTLLLIETDHSLREKLATYLRGAGYDVVVAAGRQEGMSVFTSLNPDLVLCDLDIPAHNGMDLLESLRVESPLKPIIVMSSASNMNDVLEALRLGANDYLSKPLADLKMLEHAIERCLEHGRLRQQNLDYRRRLEQSNQELQQSLKLLEQDQKAGRQVQFKMLPATPKQFGNYHFSHRIVPSLYLSGDFVDYFTVGDDYVVFFIADVSGHGASSAFVTVLLKNLFAHKRSDYRHLHDATVLSPVKLLQRANRVLLRTGIGKHVTLAVGVLNMKQNSLCYSIAGHLPLPLIVAGNDCYYLQGDGMPIGLFEQAEFSEQTLQLPDNFVLTLFTDGILEVLGVDGVLQQEQALKEKLSSGIRQIDDIAAALDLRHVTDVPDDIAVLLISRQSL